MTTKMMVICTGDASVRFDREYYANAHFKLAKACWDEHGLQSAEAFFPHAEGGDWISTGVYTFSSEQGIHHVHQVGEALGTSPGRYMAERYSGLA